MPRKDIDIIYRFYSDKVPTRKKVQASNKRCKLQGDSFFKRIDLLVSGDFDIAGAASAVCISRVGTPFDGKIREGLIYRLRKMSKSPVRYPYLVVSDTLGAPADVLTVNNFRALKERMSKKLKKGTGIEVTVASARKMDASAIGKWIAGIKELYSFCQMSGCQLVLSSGASSISEMVSGQSFDAILKICEIDPQKHWQQMDKWLERTLSKRVSI
jgi:hypothetical protein